MGWGKSKNRTRLRYKGARVANVVTRQCVSQKMCYVTYEDALKASDRMMERGFVEPMHHMTAYKCDQCSYFHIGNNRIYFKKEGGDGGSGT